ncbi:high mobility group protein dsp1 [Anaeramoeba ignava]|uniref:High mobility group protein dsp1 n=1 Tax=Anaeramoeba ignava TaxID=1746090 RepID=A0A9Q0R6B8_ANAIG|nr:high mobility group protein dsp1 [Anaeramoeba ignava]
MEQKQKRKKRKTPLKTPKKSAFLLFLQDQKAKILKKKPNLSGKEISKEGSKIWKKLSNQEKEKYKKKAREEQEKINEEINKSEKNGLESSSTSESEQEKKIPKTRSKFKIPKSVPLEKPLSPYRLFMIDTQKKNLEEFKGISVGEYSKKMSQKWIKLPEEEKKKFFDESKRQKENFQKLLKQNENQQI